VSFLSTFLPGSVKFYFPRLDLPDGIFLDWLFVGCAAFPFFSFCIFSRAKVFRPITPKSSSSGWQALWMFCFPSPGAIIVFFLLTSGLFSFSGP